MLNTIINLLQSIGNFLYEIFYAAKQFFSIVSHLFQFVVNGRAFDLFLPPVLGTVCSVSILIFVVKIILGASTDG